VLVGGGGERKTLRLVAEHADIWHGFGDVETFARKSRVLDGHCADVGRDPAQVERSVGVRQPPEAIGERLVELGASLFTVGLGGPEYGLGLVERWVAWRDRRGK
jgi:hypothetical protein